MRNRYLFFTFLMILSNEAVSQTSTANYVMKTTMTGGNTSMVEIGYLDGLGRESQTVSKAYTPSGKDMVSLQEYDTDGRPSAKWIPTPMLTTTGELQTVSSLKSRAQTVTGDTSPYSTAIYEDSPLGRIREQYGPGSAWRSASRRVVTDYTTNTSSNNCRRFSVTVGGTLSVSGYYQPGELDVTSIQDEDMSISYVFTDVFGHEILHRNILGGTNVDTYSVYDNLGNLRYVLPPSACSELPATGTFFADGNDALRDNAYYYEYDTKNRCVKKKLPGCEPVIMRYDHADRMVFSQDGEQRTGNLWTFYLYDRFGRLAVKGIHHGVNVPNTDNVTVLAEYTGNGAYGGYTCNLNLDTGNLLEILYYDSYAFCSQDTHLQYVQSSYGERYQNGAASAKGLLTGRRIYRSSTGTYTDYVTEACYYDMYGQVIQSHTTNHLGGYDHNYCEFSLTGKPLGARHVHSVTGQAAHTETVTYTYDHGDRQVTVTHQTDQGTPVTIVSNAYDELGRLTANARNGNTSLLTSHSYNVRSWLTGISNPLFSESLWYNESHEGNTPLWGGNISAQQWQTDGTLRGYNLTYDGLSRLTQAAYRENGSSSSKYTTQYTYDIMGKPLTLKRRGKLDDGSFGLVDDMTYTYDSNRLLTITDANEDEPTYQGAFHFSDGADEDEEYAYDNNGNRIMDLNKGIVNIGYNLLNLPSLITFQDSSKISYLYDADGNKLRVTYTGGLLSPVPNSIHIVDYCGNCIYEDGTLSRILIDGGYITFESNIPKYHFYIQDHLGNIRVVADQSGVAEQVNHYYPYGGIIADISTNQDIQRHKYNGKEYDRMYGLNLYDYGARHYDPATLAWTAMDPLAEKYYPITPYGYCHNDPIRYTDPDGRDDYYDRNGNFLGSNSKETDYIYIAQIKNSFMKDGLKYNVVSGIKSINDVDISAKSWSKILTRIAVIAGVDVNDLKNSAISVGVLKFRENDNLVKYEFQDEYNDCNDIYGNEKGELYTATTRGRKNKGEKADITAFIYPIGEAERENYSTVANIKHLLMFHEYNLHYLQDMLDGPSLDRKLINHSLWRKLTTGYKNEIINRLRSW